MHGVFKSEDHHVYIAKSTFHLVKILALPFLAGQENTLKSKLSAPRDHGEDGGKQFTAEEECALK